MDKDEVRKKVLNFLETDRKIDEEEYNFFVNPLYVHTYETKERAQYKKSDNRIPDELIFKHNRLGPILLIVVINCVLLGFLVIRLINNSPITYICGVLALFIVSLIISLQVLFKLRSGNVIKLNNEGITYNDEVFLWSHIVTTHIQYRTKGKEYRHSYLIIGLVSGEIKVCDISSVNFGRFFWDTIFSDERMLGRYVEFFKARYNHRLTK